VGLPVNKAIPCRVPSGTGLNLLAYIACCHTRKRVDKIGVCDGFSGGNLEAVL
jgi:hypothetical protein